MEYEIEQILQVKFAKGRNPKKLYLVKWKGYSDDENTWEPESNLDKSIVIQFEKAQKILSSIP
jgi:hypothetical protein